MRPEPSLQEKLQAHAQAFSGRQKALARFISENYQRVAFSTIRQLSAAARVSEATTVRFARFLGFKGYAEFQREIRRIVRAELKGNERFQLSYKTKRRNSGPLAAIIGKEIENLSYLQEKFDEKRFRKAVSWMSEASGIVIVGTRSTASLATHFWFGLAKLEHKVHRICLITTETYDFLSQLDPKALLIVIGFPRYLTELKDILEFSRERHIRSLVLTDSAFSPLRGDLNLYMPAESTSFMAFHCAPMVLINALIEGLSLKEKEESAGALKRFERLAEARGYFVKG
jgi:DNA-binding MurR/RpiR family transcriptional regulator